MSDRRSGVVIRDVDPDGAAADSGLKAGDVISQVNGRPVKTPEELKSALDVTSDRPALLLVTRDKADIFVALRHPRT